MAVPLPFQVHNKHSFHFPVEQRLLEYFPAFLNAAAAQKVMHQGR
jgi:hypothetical protein